MARIKRSVHAKKKRRKVLERASGYKGARSRRYRTANEQVMHAMQDAYRDRRARKGDFRRLWITRINAASRQHGLSYSRFIAGLKAADVEVDRKMLAELAVSDPDAFGALVEIAREALPLQAVPQPPPEPVAEAEPESAPEPVAEAEPIPEPDEEPAVESQPEPAAVEEPAVESQPEPEPTETPAPAATGPSLAELDEMDEDAVIAAVKGRFDAGGLEPDDLKQIKGVGPVLEGKLHALNVMTFAQIAAFTDEDVEMISAALSGFKDRVARDDWVGQAKELHEQHHG